MNQLTLLGRLVADPDTNTTPSGKHVARFRLAVNRPGAREGEPQADFFNVQAWEKTAEFVAKYFKKGQQVLVTGPIRNNDYTDKDGVKHYAMQVTADRVFFADSKRESQEPRDQAGPDGVGGQGYYQQADNTPDPWDQPAQQPAQQAPQGQYQQQYQQQQAPAQNRQQHYQQQAQAPQQQQAPGFGPPAGQQPRQPWQT